MLMRLTLLRLRGDFDGVEVIELAPPKRALQCISLMAVLSAILLLLTFESSAGREPSSMSTVSSRLASLQQHLCQTSEDFVSILQSTMVSLPGIRTEGMPKGACFGTSWNSDHCY